MPLDLRLLVDQPPLLPRAGYAALLPAGASRNPRVALTQS